MTNKHKHISECPSQEQLVKYAFEELSTNEAHQAERHMLNCAMCEDVVEGLQKFESKQQYLNTVEKVISKTQVKRKVPYLAIAAGLAIVIGLSVFFTQENNNPQLSEDLTKKEAKATVSVQLKDTIAEEEENVISKKDSLEAVQQSDEAAPSKETKKVEPSLLKNKLAANSNTKARTTETFKALESASAEADALVPAATAANTVVKSNEGAIADELNDALKENYASLKREEAEVPAAAKKPVESQNKDYFSESTKYGATLAATDVQTNAVTGVEQKKRASDKGMNQVAKEQNLLSQAENLIQQGKQEQAIALLNKIISNDKSMLLDEAKWKKALCLKQLNRIEDAKKLFAEIAASKSKYSQQANEELK